MEYDRAAVLEAWKKAVNRGVIDTAKLRPEIARAWARCMSLGVDPWSSDFSKSDEALLASMRRRHAAVMEAASPVLQYLLTLFNCNASIADMHGFVFDLVTPLSAYPRTLGTYVTEPLTGCGNITITIQDRKPCRVDGYEHYRAISQNYSGVAALIRGVGSEEYVLCINDPFVALPQNALKLCVAAAALVEKLGASRREAFSHLSSAAFFDPVIESDSLAVIVTDPDGMVLTANSIGKKALSGFEKYPYGSRSLGEYLKNRQQLPALLDEGDGALPEEDVAFKGAGRGKGFGMKLLRRRRIDLINGTKNCVLVFESPVEAETPEPAPLLRDVGHSSDYIGQSPQWRKVDELIRSVAVHRSNVMIMGDTGTGKEVAARALHRMSGRTGEFVAINCGALPRDLLASELFGYEGGAFTGARSSGAKGKFEYANGGTLFFDEIGDMPIDMQVSLLRVLQEQSVTRIGANKSIPINVRVVAATNQDLQKLISEGKFRSDLWYRLSVIEIYLPRLSEREGDVALLAEYFNQTLSQSLNMGSSLLSGDVLDFLDGYSWPGNVRELKNVMEKALIVSNGRPLRVEDFPNYMSPGREPAAAEASQREPRRIFAGEAETPPAGGALSGKKMRDELEREKIVRILSEEQGNISRSAKRLNISRNTLYRKIEKLDIRIKVQAFADK
ncbi:MAG: sigma 54-interacting transcriptional regulator [Oscillospiraceae bacterium]|nr:sigma 54-interacting transcriptional regulator [Oscillospiraceae bacterium]